MDVKIKRALISVSDKTGVVEFAKELCLDGRNDHQLPAARPNRLQRPA